MKRSSDLMPTLRSWIVAGVLGTSLAVLFDGERGAGRRAALQAQGRAVIYRLRARNRRGSEGAGTSRPQDRRKEWTVMYAPDNPNPDDNTLRDRIESEAFRHDTAPHGEYNLNVEDGVAVLRGQLSSEADIQRLIELVAQVPDVRAVESYLHTPGTPAPNKESALEASDHAGGS